MLLNLNESKISQFSGTLYDVCICGAGPAGITLARKLAGKGWKVALMEGGGSEPSSSSQQLYQGDSLGIPYSISASRLRYFGGASNHWGGETRPLDTRDFNSLPYHPFNEWPISKQDLEIYAQEVNDILDLDSPAMKSDVFQGKTPDLPLMHPAFRFSNPITRFGKKYGEEITNSSLIHLYLNANLVDILLNEDHNKVSEFVFRLDSTAPTFPIRAQHFILCCGGLENPRVLLSANRQMPQGIGNQDDMVGRHFCEHLAVPIGTAVMRSHIVSPGFNICSDKLMESKECLSFLVEFGFTTNTSDSSFFDRIYDAVFGSSEPDALTEVYVIIQQACNPHSRVTLSDERDGLGLKRLALNWQHTALDQHTIRTAAIEVAQALAKHDIGRMKVAPFVLDKTVNIPIGYMNHHMCTTRMSEDARTGVVDRNCQVFGLENFFIGGSSVFASPGVSNPTYTIIQLALRLATHIDKLLT